MNTKFTINGQTYNSIEEMPPQVRQAYEQAMSVLADRDGNGIPDILESGNTRITTSSDKPAVTVVTSTSFKVNGQKYESWEDVPPDLRSLLSQAGAAPFKPADSTSARSASSNNPRSTISFQITPSMLLAVLAAIGVALLIGWFFFGR